MKQEGSTWNGTKIKGLDTSIVNMTAESLNFWLTRFVEELCKEDGERHPPTSDLYRKIVKDRFALRCSDNCVVCTFSPVLPCD